MVITGVFRGYETKVSAAEEPEKNLSRFFRFSWENIRFGEGPQICKLKFEIAFRVLGPRFVADLVVILDVSDQ